MTSGSIVRLVSSARPGDTVTLKADSLRALLEWKPRAGEAFTVVAPDGSLLRARLTRLTPEAATLLVFEDMRSKEGRLEVTLLQALPEKERMELIIQKTTELGVTAIVPFKSEKSISLEERDSKQKKSARWNDVALRAARQSRRPSLVSIHPYALYNEALEVAAASTLKLLLSERPGCVSMKELFRSFDKEDVKNLCVMAGPEGGLTDEEAQRAQDAGFVPVSLGNRILRTETAAIIAVGIAGYELGD